MVSFLLNKPISVLSIFIALLVLSGITTQTIPTSLLPNLDVPEITVKMDYPENSAREIENNATRVLRNQLLQVSQLKDIQSESRDESAIIRLFFDYGVNTDLAFLEVNEKIDAVMNSLPREMNRPQVIKASSTDIPVLKLTVGLDEEYSDERFLELSKFIETVLKKRIEQLEDVAIADLNGLIEPEISIQLNEELISSLKLSQQQIISTIESNNLELGNLTIQNGSYQYNFIFDKPLTNSRDIEAIPFNVNGRLIELKDIATIVFQPEERRNAVIYNGEPVIIASVIKQSDAQVYHLKQSLNELLVSFEEDYPELDFHIHQDQSKLLKLSINNLSSSLVIGSLLAMVIMFLFIRDRTSPWIIALSIPASLLISVFVLYLFKFSINIVTLSGLILGVGLMIDNAIIVIDNIIQKREIGLSWFESCSQGTTEIISPLISSALTTTSVFFPLVFLSGITGALFFAQAVSVAIGLSVSLLLSITVIPVILYLFKRKSKQTVQKINETWYAKAYHSGFNFFFKQSWLLVLLSIGFIGLAVFFYYELPKTRLPRLSQQEAMININWNENITVDESRNRLNELFSNQELDYVAELGESQQLVENTESLEANEALVYVLVNNEQQLNEEIDKLQERVQNEYPDAIISISPPKDAFQQVFGNTSAENVLKVYDNQNLELPDEEVFFELQNKLPDFEPLLGVRQAGQLIVNREQLLLYNVEYDQLVGQVKTLFNQNQVDFLKSTDGHIPIKLASGKENEDFQQSLRQQFVMNKDSIEIPITNLLAYKNVAQYEKIQGDRRGEYLAFQSNDKQHDITSVKQQFNTLFFNYQQGNQLGNEIYIIVLVSLLLLYFILASQFESLLLPFIILIEIPIDVGGAFLLLYLFGGSINVMSIIGIVVMAGIIINDSILKIHTINRLHKNGLDLRQAIQEGGTLRLKPILMTSLTTILALVPFFFLQGLGVELQLPLAIAVIGGLLIGTLMSLFLIPVLFFWIKK